MATGTVKRHDTEPSPRLVINAAAGGAYNLTNHSAKMIMRMDTTLYTAMDSSQTTVQLPEAVADVIEEDDVLLIDHERMQVVTPLPTQPVVGSYVEFNVTRAVSKTATAGIVIGSQDVAGGGANQYRLSTDAAFDIAVDGGAPATVTVLAADTSSNSTMSELVADVQSAVTLAGLTVTVGNANDKLSFESSSTGTTSSVAISNVQTPAADELGLVAAYGSGEAAETTAAAGHAQEAAVNILKIERAAIIENPATDGKVTFEWVEGDTDRLGEFELEFEIITPQGKKFTVPNNDSFSVEFVADFNDL
jgi:hypothetical protein